MPETARNNVLLPQPLVPRIPTISPRFIDNEISLTTVFPANVRLTFSNCKTTLFPPLLLRLGERYRCQCNERVSTSFKTQSDNFQIVENKIFLSIIVYCAGVFLFSTCQ